MNSILGALIEAWGEIKINKGRFILSLVGVGVAVWAMATVLAFGGMLSAVDDYYRTVSGDRPGMITLYANEISEGEQVDPYAPPWLAQQAGDEGVVQLVEGANGIPTSRFGAAARATAESLEVTNWSRSVTLNPEVYTSNWTSKCDEQTQDCWGTYVELTGVDPIYSKFFAREILQGRNLTDSDALLQMNPVVINERLWKMIGSPSLQTMPRMFVTGDPGLTLTIVGVLKEQAEWEVNQIFMHYDGLMASAPKLKGVSASHLEGGELRLLAPVGEEKLANDVALSTLRSELDTSFDVNSNYSEGTGEIGAEQQAVLTTVVSIIGGIVISLGAFGLLTVSIVTVRQRIREIGIRRAMGASARRVFFSVFLESVVATTAAGCVGVMLSIFTVRFMPADLIGFPIPFDSVPYPMSAALLGVLIAAGVGALAGIIPATIAVRVKPIDAIRF
ncbi:MAG TPA: FtsX-like permease family protein [Actinomyces sp.]|nr:FtsX-like permease family protein [Actinomyces sp.]